MHKRKHQLSKTFEQLSRTERERFGKYVRSPYLNSNEDLVELWDHLRKRKGAIYPLPSSGDWQKLDSPKINHLVSKLNTLIIDFLAEESLREDQRRKILAYAALALKLENESLWNSTAKKAIPFLNRGIDEEDFMFEYNWYRLCYKKENIRNTRSTNTSIDNIREAIARFTLLELIRYENEIQSLSAIFKKDWATLELSILKNIFPEKWWFSSKAIIFFDKLYLLGQHPFEKDINDFLALLFNTPDGELSELDRETILNGVQNIQIQLYIKNSKSREYLERLFAFYTYCLERRASLFTTNISASDLKNIVNTACKLRKFQWAYDFLQERENAPSDALKEELGKTIIAYCKVAIYSYSDDDSIFSKNRLDLKAAREVLVSTKMNDPFLNLDSRTLLIEMYIKDGRYEELFLLKSHLNTSKVWLERNKEIENLRRKRQIETWKFAKRIVSAKMKGNSGRKDLIKLAIELEVDHELNQSQLLWKLIKKEFT